MPPNACDRWFVSRSGEQKLILLALRKQICAAGKNITEEFKWSRPCYTGDHGLFCYLHSTKHHATLGFAQGASLDDPRGLLKGTGKAMRHIKLATRDDLDAAAIKALLKQAVRL